MIKASALTSVLASLFLMSGCSSSGDGADSYEQNLVPDAAKTLFDQAGMCDAIFKRHAAIRDTDLKDGLIRWECGDVPGVTSPDLGQEYCEYHAISEGKIAAKASDMKPGAKLSCLFTGVYGDVKGIDGRDDRNVIPSKETILFGQSLGDKLAAKENLGAVTDEHAVVMQRRFNIRGAATSLISDCAANAKSAPPDEARQAACYEASLAQGPNQAKFSTLCRGKVLNDTAWTKVSALGAKVAVPGDANYEFQHDIAACLRTVAARGKAWRNSDPLICTRATRAADECAVQYNPIPPTVDGFSFTGWTNRALPTGCRFAKVDGKEYGQLVICEASEGEVEDMPMNPSWAEDLQQFCHDRFANDLVMVASLRALQKSGSSQGKFCSDYQNGWHP